MQFMDWDDFNMWVESMEDSLVVLAEDGYWITADGDDIHISEMTTSHLFNALNFIRRKGDEFVLSLYEDQLREELNERGFETSFL